MNIMFGVGCTSFVIVGLLWIVSELTHRPIIGTKPLPPAGGKDEQENGLDEKQAAVTAATWSILHPPG